MKRVSVELWQLMADPNPQSGGQRACKMLADAGILSAVNLLNEQAEALNKGFLKRMRTGKPYVQLKLAMSLDGRTAMASGESKWITGDAARADVQKNAGQSDRTFINKCYSVGR